MANMIIYIQQRHAGEFSYAYYASTDLELLTKRASPQPFKYASRITANLSIYWGFCISPLRYLQCVMSHTVNRFEHTGNRRSPEEQVSNMPVCEGLIQKISCQSTIVIGLKLQSLWSKKDNEAN